MALNQQDHRVSTALVTGGASGLGREFCIQLAARGWEIVVADIDLVGAQETLDAIAAAGGTGYVETLDVTNIDHWLPLRSKLQNRWSRLDLLVNNAGVCSAGKIGGEPIAAIRRVCEVNLFGVIHGCHTFVPWLQTTAPGGAIVNIASVAAVLNAPAMAAYNVSKAGVLAYTETLYAELHGLGIGVTVVLPGFFSSHLLTKGTFSDELYRRIATDYVQHSTITPERVVRETLLAVERGKLHAAMGRRVRLAWLIKRIAPSWFHRLVAWIFARNEAKHSAPVEGMLPIGDIDS